MTPASGRGSPLPGVRTAVRALLLKSPAFLELSVDTRRELAEAMVAVCNRAAILVREEIRSSDQIDEASPPLSTTPAPSADVDARPRQPVAVAQAAGDAYSGVAAQRVAGTTKAILDAVSFPRFVTDLINGVFKAMLDSSAQQMNQYVELLKNVAASTEGFDAANVGDGGARGWLVESFPASFKVEAGEEEGFAEEGAPPTQRLTLRPGASMPPPEGLRVVLGLPDGASVPSGDPENLVPLARRQMAVQRQQMLSTMVQMGMQRIVIESGRISASMRFHIDTRSVAADDRGSRFDFQNQLNVAGSFGAGPWGVSAAMQNTIGYVSTERTQTTEEMNTELDLNSSVEVVFKSDYLPLNRMASASQVAAIRQNSLNPAEEERAAIAARQQRLQSEITAEGNRSTATVGALTPGRPQAPAPGADGTVGGAEKARTEANKREAAEAAKKDPAKTPAPGAKQPARGAGTPAPGAGTPAPGAGTPAPGANQPAVANQGASNQGASAGGGERRDVFTS